MYLGEKNKLNCSFLTIINQFFHKCQDFFAKKQFMTNKMTK